VKHIKKAGLDLESTFEEGDKLLNKVHRALFMRIDTWQLQDLLYEMDVFTSKAQTRWLGKRKLRNESKNNLNALLEQIDDSHLQVRQYRAHLETTIYHRVQGITPPEMRDEEGRDLRNFGYWVKNYSKKLFSSLGVDFPEKVEHEQQ
jgi:hypothetical protein